MNGETQLAEELGRWHDAGLPVRLWLRDDDATASTTALERLIAVTVPAAVPVSLAVIPAEAQPGLAVRLAGEDRMRIAVHGFAHRNHAPATEKKQELGAHRPAPEVLADLARGREKLERLFGDRLDPLLVPPWNRIADAVVAGLPGIGLSWLSTFAAHDAASAVPGLGQINCHVDLVDWRGGRRGKPWPVIAGDLAGALALAREDGGRCVGVLSHHLAHDDTAWAVLERLTGLPGVTWTGFRRLAGLADGR